MAKVRPHSDQNAPWVDGLTIGQALRETARRHPDSDAFVFCNPPSRMTWREFDAAVDRVARALLDCAKPDGIVWKVDVGSEDVARIVGASREMVSRVLKNLREAGLIGRCGRRIDILNHDGLHKECVRTSPRAAQEGPSSLSGRPAMTRVVLKARMRERGLEPDRMRGGGTGPRGPAAGPQSGKGGGPGPRARQPQG